MRIDYDPEADAIYIQLREGEIDNTVEAGKNVVVDVDAEGIPLGLELLFAGGTLSEDNMASVTVNIVRSAQPA